MIEDRKKEEQIQSIPGQKDQSDEPLQNERSESAEKPSENELWRQYGNNNQGRQDGMNT